MSILLYYTGISAYNIFCSDTVLYCVTTDSIINIMHALFVFDVMIEFD